MSGPEVHAQQRYTFILSFIVAPLLAACLTIELQLLSIQKRKILHSLSFTVGD